MYVYVCVCVCVFDRWSTRVHIYLIEMMPTDPGRSMDSQKCIRYRLRWYTTNALLTPTASQYLIYSSSLSLFLSTHTHIASTYDTNTNRDQAFNVAIATIFAREVLEGCVIIGQYRTAVIKHPHMDEDIKKERLRAITWSASLAGLLAVIVVLAVAIPLGILSSELDERVVEIIEGVSKVIAAICILQLSVKMPEYLGLYRKVSLLPWKKFNPEKERAKEVDITIKEIRFNVAWNIWREVAECGVFLIPFFLGTGAKAIPLSGLVGIAISLILGIGIYVANNSMKNKLWLAWVMSGLTLFLSVGLFVGGCHEFEEVWGETDKYVSSLPPIFLLLLLLVRAIHFFKPFTLY